MIREGSPSLIQDAFWSPRLKVNAEKAIFHQWEQLEKSKCIDNFRIAAGDINGVHQGWFFADSDAYKWLDAAARIYNGWPSADLKKRMDAFIDLIQRSQENDGYLYTYNQLNFPGSRWENLMIEHELYCHGHLIEAGVSHFNATGETTALTLVERAADLLVREFLRAGPSRTSGHEEVEIALLRLYQVTGCDSYERLAAALLERRGRVRPFVLTILPQIVRFGKRRQCVESKREQYRLAHPEHTDFQLPPGNYAKEPRYLRQRWMINALSGKLFQMHTPIRKQRVPVGHAVRFGYLETAVTMLLRSNQDRSLLPALESAWERMVTRRMYVTGGLGAVPGLLEGFGRDYELNPVYAYAETCAALANLLWNWEMAMVTGEARYSELFEWQLYNAAAVGMGLEGNNYLFNNPLTCQGGVTRKPWFAVPCCPSNLSRTWASLGKFIYSSDKNNLWVNQYIGSKVLLDGSNSVRMESKLPWEGKVNIKLDLADDHEMTLHLRIPIWANKTKLTINDRPFSCELSPVLAGTTACGYDPRPSKFLPVSRMWSPGDLVGLDFEIPLVFRYASRKVRGHRGKVALTCGPLVYCLENIDNPDIDIFTARIRTNSFRPVYCPSMLGGIIVLHGETIEGKEITAIPYHLWANRGESQMTVWINI